MNGDGDEAEKGRTRVISGTSHPVWKDPPEAFILTAVEEIVFEVRENTEAGNVKCPIRVVRFSAVHGLEVNDNSFRTNKTMSYTHK